MAKRQAHTIRFPLEVHEAIQDDLLTKDGMSFNEWVIRACNDRLHLDDKHPAMVDVEPSVSGNLEPPGDVTKSIADFVRAAHSEPKA